MFCYGHGFIGLRSTSCMLCYVVVHFVVLCRQVCMCSGVYAFICIYSPSLVPSLIPS